LSNHYLISAGLFWCTTTSVSEVDFGVVPLQALEPTML